jgi:hypothetical protein
MPNLLATRRRVSASGAAPRELPNLGVGETVENSCAADLRLNVKAPEDALARAANIEAVAIDTVLKGGEFSLEDVEETVDRMLKVLAPPVLPEL